MDNEIKRKIAIHEAGHAVSAYALGMQVKYIVGNYTRFNYNGHYTNRAALIVSLSGYCAEAIAWPDWSGAAIDLTDTVMGLYCLDLDFSALEGTPNDATDVSDLISSQRKTLKAQDRILLKHIQETISLLQKNWRLVENLADAILNDKDFGWDPGHSDPDLIAGLLSLSPGCRRQAGGLKHPVTEKLGATLGAT